MSYTPLNTAKLKVKKKSKLNLKVILPILALFIVFAGILGGMVLRNKRKTTLTKAEGQWTNCEATDGFIFDGRKLRRTNGTFDYAHSKCNEVNCDRCYDPNPTRGSGVTEIDLTEDCGSEQLDIFFGGQNPCWVHACYNSSCTTPPPEEPTPTQPPPPPPPTDTPTPIPTVIPSPTPTTPPPSPTQPSEGTLSCGQRGCPSIACTPNSNLVCAGYDATIPRLGYCSLPNLVEQCIANPGYAGCCTIPSPTPTPTDRPGQATFPSPTPTNTPTPTRTPTPPPGSTNTPVPPSPTPTEIILVQNTNTPAAAQPTRVPTIVSVGTRPSLLFILTPIIILLLGLFL